MKKILLVFMFSLVLLMMPFSVQAQTTMYSIDCAAEASGGAGTQSNRVQLEVPNDGLYADGDYWTSATVSGYLAPGSSYAIGTFGTDGSIVWTNQYYTLDQSIEVDNLVYPKTYIGNLRLQIVSGSGDIYISKAVSQQGGGLSGTCSGADSAGGSGGGGSTPTCNCGCPPAPTPPPPPPIPDPPNPTTTITPPKVSDNVPNAPAPQDNTMIPPEADTPVSPPESGVQTFDLNKNQPVIQVDTSQSKPIVVSDPMKNLPHDDPTTKPLPNSGLPSPYTPQEHGTAPPAPKQPQSEPVPPKPVPSQSSTTNVPQPTTGGTTQVNGPKGSGTLIGGPDTNSNDPNPIPK